ncbi:hypothetical protein [Endozoicomonas euniceicola]|uniref:Transcriptional regulator n=1 Tax=Endozoicomonas euniceicola TaxID=1234143 RepID=A0ABY6GT02_9GAMM|nr:hypothetical protein [Endozoicomonas euniceicola]UYM15888.1 hypothetical protein NX720_24225 [Endozoicomonas euniceicola]
MNSDTELWSIKSIARFLDHSINYTRNVLVKQPGFPPPRHNEIEINGQLHKSRPRWLNSDVILWAENAYIQSENIAEQPPKKRGRRRAVL